MRILLTVPHYFKPQGNGRYGSTQPNPQPRLAALTQLLRNLHTIYAAPQEHWVRVGDHLQPYAVDQATSLTLDVVICTSQDDHLLTQLVLPPNLYEQRRTACNPMLLGFECHDILREQLDHYDLFGYLEDDLILHDPGFFNKLHHFVQVAGEASLLQPNRFERYATLAQLKKVYIDFEFQPASSVPETAQTITLQSCGYAVECCRATNAHAGCFFLTQAQLARWVAQPSFGLRDTSYIGPLESAATLGIMRTFQIYKPAPRYANFLEVEHFGQLWSRKLGAVRFPASTRSPS